MSAITDLIDDDEGAYNGTSSSSTFDITVIHSTSRGLLSDITADHYVSSIIDLIKNEILNEASKNIDITANGVTLQGNKKLSYYGFPKGSARANKVDVVFRANGGSNINIGNDDEKKQRLEDDKDDKNDRNRKLNFAKFKNLKKSSKPDCIYGEMDGIECAEMSCGCSMAPQTMYDYIVSIFDKYSTAYKIKCPFHKSIEWDWDYCTEVCDMTDDEYYKWCRKRDKRKLHNFKECPNCKNLCKRNEKVVIFRMRCENCGKSGKSDWCWECAQKWNNTGTVICGNKNCTLVQLINEELAKAPLIKPNGFEKQIPSIRACPRCLTRMKFLPGCKHMTCAGCGKPFCFSCLTLKNDGDDHWKCNGYKQCPVKPVQQFG